MAVPVTRSPIATQTFGDDNLESFTSQMGDGGMSVDSMFAFVVDNYGDPVLAVVREYVANAVDASVTRGTDKPVEITVPTVDDPVFTVRDYGIGMDFATLSKNCLSFDNSTKRTRNDVIGSLGIGAKSAWTLADSFVVDTVIDGKRTAVRAARDLDHKIMVKEAPTELEQGTTISIPVAEVSELRDWRTAIETVARAHAPGRVVVDGEAVESVHGGDQWVGTVRVGNPFPDRSGFDVLSGGTLFALKPKVSAYITERIGYPSGVIQLPIGSFQHTPSREELTDSPRNRAVLDRALEVFDARREEIAAEVSKVAKNDLRAAHALRVARFPHTFAKHAPLSHAVRITDAMQQYSEKDRWTRSSRAGWHLTDGETTPAAMRDIEHSMLVITGIPENRKAIGWKKYVTEFKSQIKQVVMLHEGSDALDLPVKLAGDVTGLWSITAETPGVETITYAEMRAELAAIRETRPTSRLHYQVRVPGDSDYTDMTPDELEDLDVPIIYGKNQSPASIGLIVTEAAYIDLGMKGSDRLKRYVPDAISAESFLGDIERRIVEDADEEDIRAYYYANEYRYDNTLVEDTVRLLPHIREDHPMIAEFRAIAALQPLRDRTVPRELTIALRGRGSRDENGERAPRIKRIVDDMSQARRAVPAAYPLMGSLRRSNWNAPSKAMIEHFAAYVNSTDPMPANVDDNDE